MIEYKRGDILKNQAEALVNTVNCVGVMGRGVALQFKHAFPANYKAYVEACKRGTVQPGQMFIFDTGQLTHPRYIVNFPTKRHWRESSRMEDIEAGLVALVTWIQEKGIRSIAIPPLGSGLGGLAWGDVKSRIETALTNLADVNITIYEPVKIEENMMPRRSETPNMTPGRAALVGLMKRYLTGLLDPFITLLEVHKLMYFMQEAGEPLRLKFKKAHYGPYAENLRHVLDAIEGHFIEGYANDGDNPYKPLSLLPGAEYAEAVLEKSKDTHNRFKRVVELVEGFETPTGMELLATVHWVVTREGARTTEEVITQTHAWSQRKQQFTPRQISIAMKVLTDKGWLPTETVEHK